MYFKPGDFVRIQNNLGGDRWGYSYHLGSDPERPLARVVIGKKDLVFVIGVGPWLGTIYTLTKRGIGWSYLIIFEPIE